MLTQKIDIATGEEYLGLIQTADLHSSVALDKNYIHDQITPSATWTITHNLNKVPSATIIDSSNKEVKGDMEVVNSNQIILTFNGAFSGKAHLN